MFPGRQAWLVLNQHTAESLLVCIASTTADYCPCISLIKIDSAYKIYYHSCVVLNHARKGYFWIVPECVIAQCWLILQVNLDDQLWKLFVFPTSLPKPTYCINHPKGQSSDIGNTTNCKCIGYEYYNQPTNHDWLSISPNSCPYPAS